MNQGTTVTETTMLDDSSSGRASLCDSSSAASTSLRSASSAPNIISDGMILVYNYKARDFEKFSPELMCEQICSRLCRKLCILPTTQLLFGIRLHEAENRWVLPGEKLESGNLYAFRLRFKVPEMYSYLKLLDESSHGYLYYQMRSDMLREHIAEIRYPAKKDNVMGLGVVDMVVDMIELNVQPESIERKYKNYLPRKLLSAHGLFAKGQICTTFRELQANHLHLDNLKWHYIHEIYNLAPKYLLEQFKAVVDHLPDEAIFNAGTAPTHSTRTSTSTLITASNATLATTATMITNGHSNHSGSGSDSISVGSSSNGNGSSGGAISGLLNLMHFRHNHSGRSRSRCESDVTRTTTTSCASTNSQSTNTVTTIMGRSQRPASGMAVYLKVSLHDSAEPGLMIANVMAEDKLKWLLVAKIDDIYALYKENDGWVRLEINGFPKGYRLHFDQIHELKSFTSYLGGYMRLTKNWMLDLCMSYLTPSLQELKLLRCHGPIGGSYSVAKIHQKRDECGSYIIRQCEKEYDVYYIDINTRPCATQRESCRTETFQIRRDVHKWLLNYNGETQSYETLVDLAQSIPCESEKKFRIPPSDYDKPPLLLICLPKNLQSKKTDTELSDTELQRNRAQIFDPKTDLQWYINSFKLCDNGQMGTYRADWIQRGSVKDVPVTLKVLSLNADFSEFIKLADKWSLNASPQCMKLYGLTLSTPFTMVMEFSEYGPLNDFLHARRAEIKMLCLLDVIHGLVRGMHYLQDKELIHSYIRCANMYVKKYDPHNNILEAKISDPGLPRPYRDDDLPWIPVEYYGKLQEAKKDPTTQHWAFATTIWEIFARGRRIGRMGIQQLIGNLNRFGGILEPHDETLCPKPMYETMMDGWKRDEPDKRFDHQMIFAHLNEVQNGLMPAPPNYAECGPDTCSTSDESFDFDVINGHAHHNEQGHNDVTNLTFSNNSTMPLLTDGSSNGNSDCSPTAADAACMAGFNLNGTASTNAQSKLQRIEQQQQQQQQQWVFPSKYCDDTPSVLQIDDGKVIYKEKNKIGQGHYGTVYRGEIRYNDPNRPPEQVAIKKLKSNQMKKLNDDFAREIKIMQTLDHPNVVKFKYWIDEPISIIMEYFEYGCFMVYLTSRKPNLTNAKLLRFALNIAEGMNYLRSKEVIHRDLAARNILVDRDCVKISDFGLAQIADSDGYYFARSVREIPIKWYSPESIKTSKFSFQSDVWSYGVTLFEMFSRGEIPNLVPGRDLTQEEFLNLLDSGERLRQPPLCPDSVYQQLMRPCWHANPKMRPIFKQIIDIIQYENGETI